MKINKLKSISLGAIIGVSTCLSFAEITQELFDYVYDVIKKNSINISLIDANHFRNLSPENFINHILTSFNADLSVFMKMRYSKDAEKYTLLHLALFMEDINLVNFLLNKIEKDDFKEIMKINETPLHVAIIKRWDVGVNILLNKIEKDDFKEVMKIQKNTPLHAAIVVQDKAIVDLLLNRIEKDDLLEIMEMKNSAGNTPLHAAAICARPYIFNALIKKLEDSDLGDTIPDLMKIKNNSGWTPFVTAKKSNYKETINAFESIMGKYGLPIPKIKIKPQSKLQSKEAVAKFVKDVSRN